MAFVAKPAKVSEAAPKTPTHTTTTLATEISSCEISLTPEKSTLSKIIAPPLAPPTEDELFPTIPSYASIIT